MIWLLLASCAPTPPDELGFVLRAIVPCDNPQHGRPGEFGCLDLESGGRETSVVFRYASQAPQVAVGDFVVFRPSSFPVNPNRLEWDFRFRSEKVDLLHVEVRPAAYAPRSTYSECQSPERGRVGWTLISLGEPKPRVEGDCVEGFVIREAPCVLDGQDAWCTQIQDQASTTGRQLTLVSSSRAPLGVETLATVRLGRPTDSPNRQDSFRGQWVEPWPLPFRWE